MKEACEVPNFLEEVDECRKVAELPGQFVLQKQNKAMLHRSEEQSQKTRFLQQEVEENTPRWSSWEQDQLCR